MKNAIIIGIIGDFDQTKPSHIATNEAIRHAANHLSLDVKIDWLPTPSFRKKSIKTTIGQYQGLFASPGTYRNMEGAIKGIRLAREMNIPFMGTWGGFQHTLLEYARNVAGMTNAGHTETDPDTDLPLLVIASCPIENPAMAGPRLQGKLHISLIPNTMAYKLYVEQNITESFNCNYELNPEYREKLESHGLIVSGLSDNGRARIIELPDKRFFMATGFLPQLNSTPEKPHPLFVAYLKAASGI